MPTTTCSPRPGPSATPRPATAVVVVVALTLVLTSCGWFGGEAKKKEDTFRTTGEKQTLEVTPGQAFALEVPGVGTIEGAAGAFTTSGTITAQAADVDLDDAGLEVAGKGVDVNFEGTELAQPLLVTFTDVDLTTDHGTIPAVLHRADDGTTDVRPATVTPDGDLQLRTQDFSLNFPANIDAGRWFKDRIDSVVDAITRRTDADPCKNNGPAWATLTNSTNLVHTCLVSNPDKNGIERAEAQFQPNRRGYVYVKAPQGASFVWTNQHAAVRTLLAKMWREDRGTYVVLGENDKMTAGYYRPGQPTALPFYVGVNGETKLITLTFELLGVLGLNDANKLRSAVLLYSSCGKEIASAPLTRDSVLQYLQCITQGSVGQLIEHDKALWNAADIIGERAYFDAASKALKIVSAALRFLGAVLSLGSVVRETVDNSIDELIAALIADSSKAALLLQPKRGATTPPPPPDTEVNPTLNIRGTCTSEGGTLRADATGFTPSAGVTYKAWYPNGNPYTDLTAHSATGPLGGAIWSWPCAGDPAGDYTAEIIDDTTGASTGRVTFTINRPSGGGGGGGGGGNGGGSDDTGGGSQTPPQAVVTVYNQVTNGASQMREDPDATYLSSKAWKSCTKRGCKIDGTDMRTGAQLVVLCHDQGELTTNGNNNNATDAGNPGRYSSDRYYLGRWGDGRTGYISWVWINPSQRNGMGLPGC